MPPCQWQSRFLHDLTSILSGVNISLYLSANVGELFQKSGFLGKNFLYLKALPSVIFAEIWKRKWQQYSCLLHFMQRVTVFTRDWQLILNLKVWQLLIWQLMLGKSYCLLYSTGEQTQYFREIFTPGNFSLATIKQDWSTVLRF